MKAVPCTLAQNPVQDEANSTTKTGCKEHPAPDQHEPFAGGVYMLQDEFKHGLGKSSIEHDASTN